MNNSKRNFYRVKLVRELYRLLKNFLGGHGCWWWLKSNIVSVPIPLWALGRPYRIRDGVRGCKGCLREGKGDLREG